MIDFTIHQENLDRNIRKARENHVIIPNFKQMRDPEKYVPDRIKEKLRDVGLWDVNPLNLFRITWKNERKTRTQRNSEPSNHVGFDLCKNPTIPFRIRC